MVDYCSDRKMLCLRCKEYKTSEHFERIIGKNKFKRVCIDCYYWDHRHLTEADQRRAYKREIRMEYPHRYWASETISGHKVRGKIVNITTDELEEVALNTKVCNICGCKLEWRAGLKQGRPVENSPTLDRKYNGDRMTLQNTWIVCFKCNAMKRDVPLPELVEWCRTIVKKFGNEDL